MGRAIFWTKKSPVSVALAARHNAVIRGAVYDHYGRVAMWENILLHSAWQCQDIKNQRTMQDFNEDADLLILIPPMPPPLPALVVVF